MGDFDLGLSYYNMSISSDPSNIQFLMNRAHCYFDLKMHEDAIIDLETALALNNEDP